MSLPFMLPVHTLGPDTLSGWVRPGIYMALAFVFGQLAAQAPQAHRRQRRVQRLWLALCGLYLLVASSSLLQADVEFVLWARDTARSLDLYPWRRWFQLAALIGVGILALSRYRARQRPSATVSEQSLAVRLVQWGALTTLSLYLLRYVSFHYTDQLLNLHYLGLSVFSGIEGLAMAAAVTGSWWEYTQQ